MHLQDATDEALIEKAGQGHRLAYDVLVRRHLPRAYGVALRTLGNSADAEDAVQNAFTNIWVHAPSWQAGRAKFSTWLYRIVVNACHDVHRKRRTTDELPDDVADTSPTVADNVIRADVHRHVKKAVMALPERQRMAVVLCYFSGLTNPQAAKAMGMHIKALEGLLVRARKALRPQLEDERDVNERARRKA